MAPEDTNPEVMDGPASKRLKTSHVEENGVANGNAESGVQDSSSAAAPASEVAPTTERRRGMAPIKAEYLITVPGATKMEVDDDAAEAGPIASGDPVTGKPDPRGENGDRRSKGRKKQNGQNKARDYGYTADAIKLCNSRAFSNEFSPRECKYGERCNLCHDLRKYLKDGRREDLDTLGGTCYVFETHGKCPAGWKCRFVKSHSKEIKHEDGRSELVLEGAPDASTSMGENADKRPGIVNVATNDHKWSLAKKKADLARSETYIGWLNKDMDRTRDLYGSKNRTVEGNQDVIEERRAQFVDPPFKASEKRRIYFGRETPVLAPLTTQGNLPFRRLCVELGAQVTYSEMALGMPLVQGNNSDWALMKAHESEIAPPRFSSSDSIVKGYDNSKDLKFGAQIAGNQPWVVIKATEALTKFLPHLRVVDINCGCPVDSVFQSGAGSALLDSPTKLERMIRGMNVVSGEVPITAKIRMGVRDNKPTALRLVERLSLGDEDLRDRLGAPGCAAITLHGRSRQQRYTKSANWSYVAECAELIKSYNQKLDDVTDTAQAPDLSTQPNNGKMYFLGNGDCYSHVDYFNHVDNAKVDSVMIGRGALIKPWIFEEIEKGQYLDKSASERLEYVEKFCKYGLENWGSDEMGIGFTRRFLLEWLSFTHRYVPLGLLEHLPPSLNDRPPAYRGRNELETLLASDNYKDWIKISEMFLGPAHPGFKFQPKHKSNSYEMEAEG
ncbi:tRNA-dihydrouridine synthase 3 [Neopestalotiopsis sp. 37M]|nr:tRNA-dihydrouridine synthase 3 [Neopestalotiopsis sp. 37M]